MKMNTSHDPEAATQVPNASHSHLKTLTIIGFLVPSLTCVKETSERVSEFATSTRRKAFSCLGGVYMGCSHEVGTTQVVKCLVPDQKQ